MQLEEATAVRLLGALPELRGLPPNAIAAQAKRRHCLKAVSQQLGFRGWGHACRIFGDATDGDFGTLLYPACPAQTNVWSASYEEAREIRQAHGGYLLPYARQFMIVERPFLETLGFDPDTDDWDRTGRDWVNPKDLNARSRLYGRRVDAVLAARAE